MYGKITNQQNKAPFTLSDFIAQYGDGIARRIARALKPRYQPKLHDRPLPSLLRPPLHAQRYAIQALALSMEINPATMLVGEMGCGKTYQAVAAARHAGQKRILVVCPPHLTANWLREIRITLPKVTAVKTATIAELEKALSLPATKEKPLFVVMPQTAAALGYAVQPKAVYRVVKEKPHEASPKNFYSAWCCPQCWQPIIDYYGRSLENHQVGRLATRRLKCRKCGGALWSAARSNDQKRPRIALAQYIKQRHSGRFDLLILDEIHEYKGHDTARGQAAAVLAEACRHTLGLTGTLTGGYASTLFHLLYSFAKSIRSHFGPDDHKEWIKRYGYEKTVKKKPKRSYGAPPARPELREFEQKQVSEQPGLSPKALLHLLGNTVFLRLEDVADDLPPYKEQVLLTPLSQEPQPPDPDTGQPRPTQAAAYRQLQEDLRELLRSGKADRRQQTAAARALLAWPDAAWREKALPVPPNPDPKADPERQPKPITVPALDPVISYPKETCLVDLARQEKAQGRKVLIYVTHTATQDITERLQTRLQQEGIKTAVLKAGSVAAEKREDWIRQRLAEGADALICSPRLVQHGLNLTEFPTIVWFENNYSIYTTRQASRRSWRIGQTQPVKVIHLAYADTMQRPALEAISRKMRSSLAVEGELPEDGLSAFAGEDEDLLVTLARQLLIQQDQQQDQRPAASLEQALHEIRLARQDQDDFLAEDQWTEALAAPETQPEVNAQPAAAPDPAPVKQQPLLLDLDELRQFSQEMQSPGPTIQSKVRARGKTYPVATAGLDLFSHQLQALEQLAAQVLPEAKPNYLELPDDLNQPEVPAGARLTAGCLADADNANADPSAEGQETEPEPA